MKDILSQFGLEEENLNVQPFGNGLINSTWLVREKDSNKTFILQKVNSKVFKQPWDIAFNTRLIDDHLKTVAPGYLFVSPVMTFEGKGLVESGEDHYRLFPFVPGSHTIDTVETVAQAREAARQFARFTKLTSGLDLSKLKITLPDFHNLSLRYHQFEQALNTGNLARIEDSKNVIAILKENKHIVDEYEYCLGGFQRRCTHHDTKISNVLFDKHDKGLCVIDLDTVMPGYFISDVGDMMRTYTCPVSEEEADQAKIEVRKEFYDAVIIGYLSEMGEALNPVEIKHMHFAGEFMIYMQALRFLTDHINNDVYYGARYKDHNLIRAINQVTLLQRYQKLNPG